MNAYHLPVVLASRALIPWNCTGAVSQSDLLNFSFLSSSDIVPSGVGLLLSS